MKHLYAISTLITFLLGLSTVYSQTAIEPIIGCNFVKNESLVNFESQNWLYGAFSDDEFQNNLILGVGITHYFTYRIFLNTIGQYSKNNMTFIDSGFAGYSDLKFNRIGITTIPSMSVTPKFQFGLGVSFQLLRNFNLGFEDRDYWTDFHNSDKQNQIGWVGSFAYEMKSIVASMKYMNLTSLNVKESDQIGKSRSIEISISYRYKVLKKRSIDNSNN